MSGPAPFFVVRAVPRQAVREEFLRWARTVHLRDVRRIPGIAAVRWGLTPGGTMLTVLVFADADAVRGALESPEAAYARGTWERWVPHLEEFQVELYAPLEPSPAPFSFN
jgi:hypothetical protein